MSGQRESFFPLESEVFGLFFCFPTTVWSSEKSRWILLLSNGYYGYSRIELWKEKSWTKSTQENHDEHFFIIKKGHIQLWMPFLKVFSFSRLITGDEEFISLIFPESSSISRAVTLWRHDLWTVSWFVTVSSLGQKKGVQIHSDPMTESNRYPPPNNSKVLTEAVAMASARKGFTDGCFHE